MEILIDPELAVKHRVRAARHFEAKSAFLLEIAAEELSLRLSAVERRFEHAVELFGATGIVAEALKQTGKIEHLERVEVVQAAGVDKMAETFEDVLVDEGTANLVVAPLSLHLVNDLPGSLIRIRRALKPDGLFLAAIPGAGTLAELNDVMIETDLKLFGGASPHVVPFGEVRALGGLLQRAGFTLPVADVETYTVRYDSLFNLMAELRAMGMANALVARTRKVLTRKYFLEAAKLYAERYADPDGRIRATFSFVYLSGWAPHESQQKPLKPGSAKMRLSDALKIPPLS